jgi:NTE family protein
MNLKPKVAEGYLREFKKIQYNNTSFAAFYHFNNTNERYYPTKGIKASFELSITPKVNGKVELDTIVIEGDELSDYGLLETSSIVSLDLKVNPIFPINQKLSVLAKARLRMSSIGNATLNINEYDLIGGFIPGLVNSNEYLGVGTKEFGAANYFYGKIGLQYELKRNLFFSALFNYLDTEYPVTWFYANADISKLGDRYRRFGYGAMLGYKSVIGPIIIGIAKDHYRSGWKAALAIGFFY